MSNTPPGDDPLDTFFSAARAAQAKPGADLTARVLADAAAMQPAPQTVSKAVSKTPASPVKPGWLSALGGWPALAGLVTATVAGVSIGVADPTYVGDLAFSGFSDAYDFSTVGTTLGSGFDLGLDLGDTDG
ncbi:MAG: dihydroorotate dehydrogenase [Pseudomonadota bacterium]